MIDDFGLARRVSWRAASQSAIGNRQSAIAGPHLPLRAPRQAGVMRCSFLLGLLYAGQLVGLAGCARSVRTAPPEPITEAPRAGAALQQHEDDAFSFSAPAAWAIKAVDSGDPSVRVLGLTSATGLFARLNLLTGAAATGAFPAAVVENLRRAQPDFAAEPYEAELAGRHARGFRYRFRAKEAPWEGYVVSFVQEGIEVGALGQFPAGAAETPKQLAQVFRALQVKVLPARAP